MIKYADRTALLTDLPKGGNAAELGVFRGDFSQVLLDVLKPRKLCLIDAWKFYDYGYADPLNVSQAWHDENHRVTAERFAGQSAVEIVREETVPAALRWPDGFFDLVYVDANHSYEGTLADLMAFAPKIAGGGRIAGHDYTYNLGFGVIPAVQTFCAREGWELIALTDEEWPSYLLERKL